MEHKNETGAFQYTYSAKEQAELKRIREKYASREEDKMERLRRLDRSVTQKAQTLALTFGILGALTLGFGMSLFMSDLATKISISPTWALPLGIGIGIVGGILASLAYPLYHVIVRKERRRLAPEILRLTDELLK